MLRELSSAIIVATAIVLLCSSGCVDEKEFTRARLECIELTSQAYARIPKCDSQEKCFAELEKRLFGFPEEELDYGVRQALFEYKNRVARSWLYYNRALERVESIRGICMNRKGFERLPVLANELNNFLLMAFGDADEASIQGFTVLFLEASELERNEVSKIREEQLFDAYIGIHNNLNALSQQGLSESDHSYYARFRKKVEEFNELKMEKGFYPIILRQFGFADFVFPFSKVLNREFVGQYKDKLFFLPFLGSAFFSLVSFLSDAQDLQESLELLRHSPTFEFLDIYSDLLGEHDSVLAEFSSLMKEDCLARKFVELENSGLEERIGERISLAGKKIDSIPFQEFSFLDENFFFSLYSLLMEEAPFSYREFDFESMREGWRHSSRELESIELAFHSVLSAKRTKRISLGERTKALKQLSYRLDELIEALEYVEKELLGSIVEKCSERMPSIESQLKEISKLQSQEWFFYSKALLEERLQEFNNSSALNERVHYCSALLEAFEELKNALKNKESEEKRVKVQIGECLDALDLFLPILKDFDSELSESIEAFRDSVSFGGLASESSLACSFLLRTAEETIRKEKGIALLEQNFHESLILFEKLSLLFERAPALKKASLVDSFEKELSELSAFFENERLDLVKALDRMPSIQWRASELKRGLERGIENQFSSYLSQRAFVQSMPVKEAVLGEGFEDCKRIEFTNPFFPWDLPLHVSIPFKHEFDGILSKSENITDFAVTDSTAIVQFSRLPEGKSFVEVFSSSIVSFSGQEKLVQLNADFAEIEKAIKFGLESTVSRMKAGIPLNTCGLNVSRLRAFFNKRSIPVFLEENKAVLFLENLEPGSELFIYYVLLKPLLVEKKLLKSSKIDENRAEQEFSLSVSNRLSFAAKNVAIMLPFPYNEENIERIEFFDSAGIERSVSLLPNNLKFVVGSILPGQRKEFLLRVRIRDESAFTQSLLEQARQKLESMLVSQNESIQQESKGLLEELGKIGSIEFRENAERIDALFDSASALEKRALFESNLESEIMFLEQEINERIAFLREEQQKAERAGFTDYSEGIEALLNQTGELLNEASGQRKADKQEAFELLNEAQIAFNEFSLQDVSEQLSQQARALFNEISEKISEWHSMGFSSEKIAGQRNEAIQLLEEFELLEGKAGFSGARERIEDLMHLSEQMDSLFREETGLAASSIVSKINQFLEMNSSAAAKAAELKKELESVSSEELVKARVLLPFQLSEIEKIERELNGQYSEHKNTFKALLEMAESGRRVEVIRKAKGIDFDELIESASEKERLLNALADSIVASSHSSLSEAKNKLNLLSDEGILQLEEAVNEARKNNYLKSLVLSKTALASLRETGEFDFSLFLFPLLILLIFLFYRSYRKARHSPKPFYRRVPRQY